jgi:hypothetical protein
MYSNPVMPRNSFSNESDERHFAEIVCVLIKRRSAARIARRAGGMLGQPKAAV